MHRRVRIHVRRDLQPLRARGVDALQHIIEAIPVLLARKLEMVDLRRHARFACNRDQLIDSLQYRIALAAHVRDVHAAMTSGLFRDGNQLRRLRIECGRVDER